MMLWWSPPRKSPCRCGSDNPDRIYDCKHCEHYHRDCTYCHTIDWALENEKYDMLPYELQKRLSDKVSKEMDKCLEDIEESVRAYEKHSF